MSRPTRPEIGLFVVGFGTLLAPLDTAVNIAFPSITQAFGLDLEDIRWVVICYVLTYASLMLVCGRLGDLVGYRPIFQLGVLLSAIGLATCAIAPTYRLLLLGRILQGVGTALTLSCGPALATALVGESQRARALAFYAGVIAIGGALGPIIGGLLVARYGWASVYWFRVPLAILALVLSWLLPAPSKGGSMHRFDSVGAILLVAWMGALLLALAMLVQSQNSLVPGGLLLLSLVAFGTFLLHEIAHPQPMIRLSLFNLDFILFNAANIVVNLAAFGVLILIPYYLVNLSGTDLAAAGAVLAVAAVGTAVGSWLAGRFSRRVSIQRLVLAGIVFNIVGLWGISTWTYATPLSGIALALFAQGLGLGLFQVGYFDHVTGTLPLADRGVAGSLTMVTRTIGVVLGATGFSAAFTYFQARALASGELASDAFLAGFQSTFLHAVIGLTLAFSLTALRPRMWRIQS